MRSKVYMGFMLLGLSALSPQERSGPFGSFRTFVAAVAMLPEAFKEAYERAQAAVDPDAHPVAGVERTPPGFDEECVVLPTPRITRSIYTAIGPILTTELEISPGPAAAEDDTPFGFHGPDAAAGGPQEVADESESGDAASQEDVDEGAASGEDEEGASATGDEEGSAAGDEGSEEEEAVDEPEDAETVATPSKETVEQTTDVKETGTPEIQIPSVAGGGDEEVVEEEDKGYTDDESANEEDDDAEITESAPHEWSLIATDPNHEAAKKARIDRLFSKMARKSKFWKDGEKCATKIHTTERRFSFDDATHTCFIRQVNYSDPDDLYNNCVALLVDWRLIQQEIESNAISPFSSRSVPENDVRSDIRKTLIKKLPEYLADEGIAEYWGLPIPSALTLEAKMYEIYSSYDYGKDQKKAFFFSLYPEYKKEFAFKVARDADEIRNGFILWYNTSKPPTPTPTPPQLTAASDILSEPTINTKPTAAEDVKAAALVPAEEVKKCQEAIKHYDRMTSTTPTTDQPNKDQAKTTPLPNKDQAKLLSDEERIRSEQQRG